MIIQSGELKEYIAAGVQKDEFLRRIAVLLESRASASELMPAPVPVQAEDSSTVVANDSNVLPSEESVQAEDLSTGSTISKPAEKVTAGEARSSVDSQREQPKKLDKGKQKADPEDQYSELPNDASPAHQKPSITETKYAQLLKKQQQDKRDERARILKLVEDDKIQRRKLAAERKTEVEKAKHGHEESPDIRSGISTLHTSKRYEECALQIRLFDGSSLRSRFSSSATLRVDVRPWIDQHQDGNTAYTFKEVLTPLPNRQITISDEEQSLQSLGLAPSATLILIPVQGSITAYGDSTDGLVSRGISTGYGWASWGAGMVTSLFGGLTGGSTAAQHQEEQSSGPTSAATPSGSTINIRTLRDQNRPDDQQFYNGNALNFEPRNEDEGKKDD